MATVGTLLVLSAGLAAAGALQGIGEMHYFPGSYFDAEVRSSLYREALESWPGPTALVDMWRTGDLSRDQRQAVLLGGAAFHDADLLAIYIEAIRDPNERIRQAAAYGYRGLLGDVYPDVRTGVSQEQTKRLEAEMRAVASTLEHATLAELWTASLLASEDRTLPGWRGVVLRRPAVVCLEALDQVATVEDLPTVATAFQMARDRTVRLGLLRFLEAFTLQQLVVKKQGPRATWGSREYDAGLDAADRWSESRCSFDPLRELEDGFARLGVRGLDPMSPEACVLWQEILLNGPPQWRGTASEMLYRCGGPPLFIDRLDPDSDPSGEVWRRLLRWFLLGGADDVQSAQTKARARIP